MSDAAPVLERSREEFVVFEWVNGAWAILDGHAAKTQAEGERELAEWQAAYPHNVYVLAKRTITEETYVPV